MPIGESPMVQIRALRDPCSMKPIRILLVDDSREFVASAAAFLTRDPRVNIAGSASNGQEAVALAGSLAPDLVLIDLSMPVMDGIAATKLLKGLNPVPRVVIVSLHDVEGVRREALGAGADGFIAKNEFAREATAVIDSLFARMVGP